MSEAYPRFLSTFGSMIVTLLVAACATGEPRDRGDFRQDPRPMATTLVYECLGYEFVARVGPGEMAVWLDDDYLILSQVRAAEGIRYQEGEIAFESKADDAALIVSGQRFPECVLVPERAPWEDARRRGVSFRAVGNEPGWHLEIQSGRQILYVGDYGMNRILVPDPGAEATSAGSRYHAVTQSNDLLLEIESTPCTDTMKGDEFPDSVWLTVNGKTLQGCGRSLDFPWR
ncbi:MAG: hypothetical protein ABJ013_02360 [Halioglobus sp.]